MKKIKIYVNSIIAILIIVFFSLHMTGCRKSVRQLETNPPTAVNSVEPHPLTWTTALKKDMSYEIIKEFLRDLMKEYGVTALSIAIGDSNRESILISLGNVESTQRPVTNRTVFQAGRLSQPLFAWLVMKLVDEGAFNIDRPIIRYLKKPLTGYPGYEELAGDPRCRSLTGRFILSHQSGLSAANDKNQIYSVKFVRDPGKRFEYSEAAYRLLQIAVEESTGKSINELAKDKVFSRLSMDNTSFVLEPRFKNDVAVSQDDLSDSSIIDDKNLADVATSLYTTSQDMMNFLWKMIYPSAEMSNENYTFYMHKTTNIFTESIDSAIQSQKINGLGWSLGWGKYEHREGFTSFHGGREPGYENFASLYTLTKNNSLKAIVVLSVTSKNSKSFMDNILRELIGDTFSPLGWMGFEKAFE